MVIFHSYVSLPEGTQESWWKSPFWKGQSTSANTGPGTRTQDLNAPSRVSDVSYTHDFLEEVAIGGHSLAAMGAMG